jgi:Phage integrase, N-terminal SAM-like domain
MPDSGAESWTVLGDDHAPVAPVERWLAYLALIERSPNTIKAYAHDLKDWWAFLQLRSLDWRRIQLEDLRAEIGRLGALSGKRLRRHLSRAGSGRQRPRCGGGWRPRAPEIRRLREENRQLRERLAWTLGELRASANHGQASHTQAAERTSPAGSQTIGPCA